MQLPCQRFRGRLRGLQECAGQRQGIAVLGAARATNTLSADAARSLAWAKSNWHRLCIEICRNLIPGSEAMDIPAISHFEQALRFRALRNQVLSSNIANADTPNYKARDLDFGAALKSARHESIGLTKTSDLHKQAWGMTADGAKTMYRVPSQPSLDGNTVATDVEQAAFAENALQYRASLAFLDGTIRTLRYAIKGGD